MKTHPLLNGFAFLLLLNPLCSHGESATPAATSSATPSAANKPSVSGEIFSFEKPDLNATHADNGATLSVANQNGKSAIKVDLPITTGYPGLTFPGPAGGWDLSDYDGVQIDLTNPGTAEVAMTMRADNAGDGKQSPWSVQVFRIKPGKTETCKVVFGRAFGGPGFALDKAHVTAIKLYATPPKAPFTVLLSNLKGSKPSASEAAAAAAAAAPALPPDPPFKAPPPYAFTVTPPIDIAGKHDFPEVASLSDDAASQLKTLCSLSEFRALPQVDRHVYSFDVWPNSEDELESKTYTFNFHLGTEGVTAQKVAFLPTGGGPGKSQNLNRSKDPNSSRWVLKGFGNLSWSGRSEHVFKFDKPVIAFGVVLRSSGDVDLRKFFWPTAKDLNGYPISYTLADGTVIQLGQRELSGAVIKGETNAFLGVIDRSGSGIISVTYTLKGLAGSKAQDLTMLNMAFATLPKPAVASVINLKSSCDFDAPETIAATPAPALEGLAPLSAFRFIVGNHRYVYHFDTWPQKNPDFGSSTGEFAFDLKGKGTVGQKVTVTASNSANGAKLTQTTLKNDEGLPYRVLGGLGDIGNGGWAEQTFKFEKPVWSFGVTYRSPNDVNLAKIGSEKSYPLSYTLSDGTVVNLGKAGASGGVLSSKGKTFVGVIDETDKGIASVTLRVQGTAKGAQSLFIEDLAFAMAGPPPGNWKISLEDNFDGDKLNPKIWKQGYTFADVINSEMQGFVPENVTVANGLCTIKVERKDCRNTDRNGIQKGPIQKYASGNFTSFDKFTQTYGYFEARLKMCKPRGAGVWPAFWMLPDRGKEYPQKDRSHMGTKDYGHGIEIDIFEFQPWWKQSDTTFPVHVGCIWSYGKVTEQDPAPHGYGAYTKDNDGWGPTEAYFPDLDTKFHTYGLYWSPERLIYYIDSKPVFRVRDPAHVPDVPEYILFNVSITGNGWGRGPGKRNPTQQQIAEDMPNQMDIDYFRAYSGTLEEAVPPAPTDIPMVLHKYPPPPKGAPEATETHAPAPAATPAPTPTPATGVPAAPVNESISSPSNG